MNKYTKIITIAILVLLLIFVIYWFFVKSDSDQNVVVDNNKNTPEDTQGVEQKESPTSPKIFVKFPEPENDLDSDGVDDNVEEQYGTSNRDIDTDGDSLSDKSEIEKWGTNPTKWDTDGDGYGDGSEIINGYSPLGE